MTIRPLCFVTCIGLTALTAMGCDDLGKCDQAAARAPVDINGRTMYVGQAVIAVSCSVGCHSSASKGEGRLGAPAGLDFDIGPVDSTTVEQVSVTRSDGTSATTSRAVSDPVKLANLRARQRSVYEQRDEIWAQVKSDMMPPDGKGSVFRTFKFGNLFSVEAGGSCTRGTEVGTVMTGETRDALRNWLACGAPVVETSNAGLAFAVDSTDPTRAAVYPGTVGDQFPVLSCDGTAQPTGDGGVDGGPSDPDAGGDGGGAAVSFTQVYAMFTANSCVIAGCHGGASPQGGLDLGTAAKAYASLLGASGEGGTLATACGTSSKTLYVVPNSPDTSYLLDKTKVTSGAICGTDMPFSGGLKASDGALLRAWIEGGATGP